jgi:hypothetical protein
MAIPPRYPRVIGWDVHPAQLSACAIAEPADGTVTVEHREFGAVKRDRRALAEWAKAVGPTVVVMASTGGYGKRPYAALERAGIVAWVVKARPVKAMPGRKTDMPMPSGWRSWRGPGGGGGRASRRLNGVTCA